MQREEASQKLAGFFLLHLRRASESRTPSAFLTERVGESEKGPHLYVGRSEQLCSLSHKAAQFVQGQFHHLLANAMQSHVSICGSSVS